MAMSAARARSARAFVFADGMTETDRQLWEIDENLMQADLSPTEHADHLALPTSSGRHGACVENGLRPVLGSLLGQVMSSLPEDPVLMRPAEPRGMMRG